MYKKKIEGCMGSQAVTFHLANSDSSLGLFNALRDKKSLLLNNYSSEVEGVKKESFLIIGTDKMVTQFVWVISGGGTVNFVCMCD